MSSLAWKRPSTRRLSSLLLPVLLAVVVASLGAASLVHKLETFQPLGFEGQVSGGGLRVVGVPRASTGLVSGDVILLVNRQLIPSGDQLRTLLAARPTTELAVMRGDQLVDVPYQRQPFEIDFRYLLLAVCGVLYLFIGLVTVAKSRQGHGLLFFFWCLASAAVFLLTPTGRWAELTERATLVVEDLGRFFLPPLMLHLFLVYPAARWGQALRRLLPFLYLPAAVLVALEARVYLRAGTGLEAQAVRQIQASLDDTSLYLLAIYLVAAVVALGFRVLRSHDLEERRQLRWMVLGVGAGYIPFLIFYLLPRAAGFVVPDLLTSLAVVPLAIVPLTFAYAILRYKLWDIEVIARDAAAWILTLLVGGLGYGMLNLMVSRGLPEPLTHARTVLSFLGGLAIASVLVPARRSIGSSLARLHYGSGFAKRRELAELGRELLHERNLDQLCSDLLDHVGSSLELDRVNLLLRQGPALVPVRPEAEFGGGLPADVLDDSSWDAEMVAISGLEPQSEGPHATLRLFRSGYRYAFPLRVRGSRVGLLVASYRWDQVPLSSEDVDLARAALNQAALAIENAKLVDQLQQQLDEVFRLQQYSEGIIESSPVGLAVLESGDVVRSANLAFAAILGVERYKLLGRRLEGILAVELPEPAAGLVEASFLDAAGRQRHLQMSVAEVGTGVDQRRILIAQDVTERVAMQHELKEKERLASLGMLAAGVAHEVNTPITGISSYAQMLLEETPEDDPRHKTLLKMERQTFRAARIVTSLLEFARQRGSEQRPLALGKVLAETLDEQRERMADRRVALTFAGDSAADLLVKGNDTELGQVFLNLINNALDAMPSGGVLTVRLEADERRTRVHFEDTGVGISAEALEKVFQPFFSTKLGEGGTGLGLSISFEIVRRHGGILRATSEPGVGSSFVVELPRLALPREVAS